MRRTKLIALFDLFGVFYFIVLFFILGSHQMEFPFGFGFFASGVGFFVMIRLILLSMVRIAESVLSDALKLGWSFLILLLPILGPICCLTVVDKRIY